MAKTINKIKGKQIVFLFPRIPGHRGHLYDARSKTIIIPFFFGPHMKRLI